MSKTLTDLQEKVLMALRQRGSTELITYRELADSLGVKHPYSVQQALQALYAKGFVDRDTANNFIIPAEVDDKEYGHFDAAVPAGWLKDLLDMIDRLPDEHSDLKVFVKSGRHFL